MLLVMPPDATDTKRRLLKAAYEEFSARGLAGARVDRIAAAAKANKQAIYAHFGNKDDLFDRGRTAAQQEVDRGAHPQNARIVRCSVLEATGQPREFR